MRIVTTIKSYLVSLYESLKRFPIAIGLSILATTLLIVLEHNRQNFGSTMEIQLSRFILVIALGIPLSLCLKLLFERKDNVGLVIKTAIYLLEAFGLVLFYFFLLIDFSMVSVTRYIALSLSFYLAFIFIPYFFRRNSFELYVIKLLTRFFITVLYAIVLFLGIAAILFTIDALLKIKVQGEIYFDVWLGVAGIFSSSFFLAGVPLYDEHLETRIYPKLLKVLLLYIVIPLTAVYTGILYIYFAKIIVTFQWPIGMVAHLVLWYAAICTVIIFLISPLHEGDKWTRTFIFLLPKLIIPLIIMMFFSIGIRVKAYGITENRYFVIVLGLWALGVMMLFNLAKNRRNIIMVISLSLVALLSAVGPWSSYSVSKFSQNHRFESILLRYNMLKGDSIIKSDQEVAAVDQKEISEILRYFSKSHTLRDVNYLPQDFRFSEAKVVFGFPINEFNYGDQNKEYFTYSSNIFNRPVDIKGYSYMYLANNSNSSEIGLENGMIMKYNNSTQEIKLLKDGKEIYKNSFVNFGKKIHDKFGTNNKYDINPNEMSFVDENEYIKVKFIFNQISGYEDVSNTSINGTSMDFYVLFNLK